MGCKVSRKVKKGYLVAIVLVLLAIIGIVGYAVLNNQDVWTAILRFQRGQGSGELMIWLIDRDGNRVRVGSGPLAFFYGGMEVYAIVGKVVFDVEVSGIQQYNYEVTVVINMYDPSGYFDNSVRIVKSGATGSTHVEVDFDKVLSEMPFDQYGTWRLQLYANVNVYSGSLQDTASSEVIEMQIEYQPDGSLSIVSVGISAGPM